MVHIKKKKKKTFKKRKSGRRTKPAVSESKLSHTWSLCEYKGRYKELPSTLPPPSVWFPDHAKKSNGEMAREHPIQK